MTRVDMILSYLRRSKSDKCLADIVQGLDASVDERPMIHGRLFDLWSRKLIKRKKKNGVFHYTIARAS
jgi:hypothetical protein